MGTIRRYLIVEALALLALLGWGLAAVARVPAEAGAR
jgi:hypothetical protein